MVWIHATDEVNVVSLSEGYLPSLDALWAARPRWPHTYRHWYRNTPAPSQFASRDEAAAWMLSTLVRRLAWYKRFRGSPIEMETSILGPSADASGVFASWFSGTEDDADYRIMIHRKPSYHQAQELWGKYWDHAYRKLGIHHRHGKYKALKRQARPFLDQLLEAYRRGPDNAEEIIRSAGHPYVRSSGLAME